MSHDALDERRHALEEQFFKKQNDALTEKMKQTRQEAATKETLLRVTGITNPQVLDTLVKMNIGGAAAMVMSLYPMVDVAWADGAIDPNERTAILEQAKKMGLAEGSEGALFLAQWLDERPDLTWRTLWADYVKALCATLSINDREQLKAAVLNLATRAAEAAGGILGMAKVSHAEQRAIDALALAFA
jgi:tellurite resistance protein